MGFENPHDAAIRSLDSRTREDEIKKTVSELLSGHEKAGAALRRVAINPERFTDLYSEEEIARDKEYVARRKEQFAQDDSDNNFQSEARRLAEVAEYEVLHGLNVQRWLPGCRGVKTSEYDDIANGVDIVLELPNFKDADDAEGYERLGLAVDITYSQNLDKKFERIRSEIERYDGDENLMGYVKYFSSPGTDFRQALSGIPRVVTAIDTGVLQDMAKSTKSTKGVAPDMHVSRHIVVLEMLEQLKTFEAYAEKVNQLAKPPITDALRLMSLIEQTLKSRDTVRNSEYTKNRQLDTVLEKQLKRFQVKS